jgi:excisionase family DNA binding protein
LATKPHSNIDVRAYRVEAAAKAYGLSRTTLYKLLREGRLRSVLIGRRRLILCDSLDALLAARWHAPGPSKARPGTGCKNKPAPSTQTPGLPQLETLAQAEAQNLRRIDALVDRAPEIAAALEACDRKARFCCGIRAVCARRWNAKSAT